jgi:uncharacterized membrane protein YfcA
MSHLQILLVALSVFGGAATQRITGLGFALVASPLLVLVIGPFQGVLLANALTLVINIIVLSTTWRAVELRRVVLLILPALLAVHFGARVTHLIPAPMLMIVIGGVVFIALLAVILLRNIRLFPGPGGALAAGALSGFMNVTAGVGGPAITLYAIGAAWEQRSFVASMQVYFGAINIASILTKGLPAIRPDTEIVVAVALFCGIALGQALTRVITPAQARQGVMALALLGAAATIVKGLLWL